MSRNLVIILGRLGQDPEQKYLPTGGEVSNFSVATSETWKDKNGQKQESTEWHRVVAYGKTAELCNKYLSKGRQVYLEGRLQTRSWEKDGEKRYATEIVAQAVQFLGSNSETQNSGSVTSAAASSASFTSDDIPF